MKVRVLCMGKTDIPYLREGIADYLTRLKRALNVEFTEIPELKNTGSLNPDQVREKEASLLLQRIPDPAFVVLLDERGKEMRSLVFAEWLQQRFNQGFKEIIFVVGGAYGFDEKVRKRAAMNLSLSSMTFSHQLVRLLFMEQLYRAMTILRNEPYHNE